MTKANRAYGSTKANRPSGYSIALLLEGFTADEHLSRAEPTLEARAEGKLVFIMPCEEEGKSETLKARLALVSPKGAG